MSKSAGDMGGRKSRPRGGKANADPRRTLRFADIFSTEKAVVATERRHRATQSLPLGSEDEPPVLEPRVGLALSGGGIRSAAFSLGVVQGLSARKAFDSIDFLSTVSGGGYTGAALIAAMERDGGKFPFNTEPDGTDGFAPVDIADSDAVRALRHRCRYLMPNGKFDLVVSFAIILRGLAVNATMVAATVFLFAAVTLLFNPTEEALSRSWVSHALGTGNGFEQHLGADLLLSKMAGIALLIWLVLWAVWRSFRTGPNGSGSDFSDPGSRSARFAAWSILALLVIFVTELQAPVLRWALSLGGGAEGTGVAPEWLSGIAAMLATGTGILALTWRWLLTQLQEAAKDPFWKALLRAAFSRLALFVLAMALPVLIYVFYVWLTMAGIRTNVGNGYPAAPLFLVHLTTYGSALWVAILGFAALTAWLAIWARSIGPVAQTLLPTRWKTGAASRSKPSRGAVFGLVLLPVAFAAGSLTLPAAAPEALLDIFGMAAVYLLIAVVLTLIAGLFSENANSLHRLYRDRLNEAFTLGLENGVAFRLTRLASPFSSGKARRPYLIVNTAVNLQRTKSERRGRSADFFIFTPSHIGSEATGYLPTEDFEAVEPHVDLATAAAISGAAVSSAMGRIGFPILAPTLALLNIRLGYWVRNPHVLLSQSSAGAAPVKDWKLFYLFYEMFGLLDEKKSKVLLSDGGHIDNLGLYQLLKRRCDVVIVSDAEADPAMNFTSLVDVERFARIDLGVRLDLPWAPIRESALRRKGEIAKGDPAPPWSHAAIGKIYYPKTAGEPGVPPEEEKEGILLYVKSSVTGDERGYILDYERRFPRFPHESTSDQFFSEEQFEAYRALGFHAMDRALTYVDGDERGQVLLKRLRGQLGVDGETCGPSGGSS